MKIKELKHGEISTVEGIITSIEEKTNSNNGTFLDIKFSDGESAVTGKKWNTRLKDFPFSVGQCVFMEIKKELYKNNDSYILRDVVESSSNPDNFICGSPVEAEVMFNFLLRNAERCGVYANVVTKILNDNKEKLLCWGAAHSVHHNIKGGLLYHTYRMVKASAYVAHVYNTNPGMIPNTRVINTELLVAGTILHDIGKLWTLETNELGESEYTPKGMLLGHLAIGANVFTEYAKKAKLGEEDIMLMQHMILSHHGLYEYNTVSIPAIPEAMILHHIDMIDSKIYQFEVNADTVEPGGMTPKVFALGQSVYRPTWRIPEPEKK